MKKTTAAILLTAAMTCAVSVTAFAAPEPEFEPNADYDKWCAIDYTIEDIGADMVVTISSNEDETKMDIQCNFYGDDQHVVTEKDGDEWKILEDKTGFMATDTPLMIAKAQEEGEWAKMGEEPAADDDADAKAVVKLPVEPEFEPNREDYDKYTAIDYTIEDIDAEMVVTLSSNEDETKMEILCNFYGDDQKVIAEKDGDEWKILEDKTGFMETDTPLMIAKAQEQNIWLPTDEEEEAALLAGAEDTEEDAAKADAAEADAGDLPYEPKADYFKYQRIAFEMESLSQTLDVVVSANEEETEFNLQMFFFGGDADINVSVDGDQYTVTNDSGFFQVEGPLVVKQAVEEGNWIEIK